MKLSRALVAVWLMVGCGGATEPAETHCPSGDGPTIVDAELRIDGVVVPAMTRIDEQWAADTVQVTVWERTADGRQRDVLLTLVPLAIGAGSPPSQSSVEYREWADPPTPQLPAYSERFGATKLSGNVTIAKLAAERGETTCGWFDVSAAGGRSLRLRGRFSTVFPFARRGAL